MKKLLAAAVAIVILAGLAHAADPARRGGTGDGKLDLTLQRIDAEAQADPDGFLKRLSARQGIPEQDLRQAKEAHGLGPADLFMATALARASRRPFLSVAEEYQKDPGRGWGAMAKDMGIKPGSRAFHELKAGASGCLGDVRSDARARDKHERGMKKEHERKMGKGPKGEGPKGEGPEKPH